MKRQKVWLLCLLFLAVVRLGYSQQNIRKDSVYVFSLINKAEDLFTIAAYDSALQYCSVAETYSRQHNFKKGIAYALIEQTDILIDKDELDKAAQLPAKTTVLGQQLNDSLITAIATMQLAQVKMYGKKYDEAVVLFEKCVNSYFSNHPSKYAALAYNDFGYTWGEKGVLEKNAANLLQALSIYEKVDSANYSELAITLSNLSTLYYQMNNRQKAIEYGKKSIAYREKTGDIVKLSLGCCNLSQLFLGVDSSEALRYQQLCVQYAEQSGDPARILHSYTTSSLIASSQKDFKKAVDFELKIISALEKTKKDPDMLARRYISLAIGSAALNEDSAAAVSYFNKAAAQSLQLNNKLNLRDVYYHLTGFYKKHNDFTKAYEYYGKYILYRDSIVSGTTASSIAELEKKYQTEKKDNEISQLNAEKRISQLQIEKQKALLAGNLLEAKKKENEIALLSKQKELQALQLSQQEAQLEKQLLQSKNNEQQLQLAAKEKQLQHRALKESNTLRNFLLAGLGMLLLLGYILFSRYQLKQQLKEQEAMHAIRNNIAKDLHDDIGASLSNINILNELAKRNVTDPSKINTYLERSGEDIQQVSESISDIVWNINPKSDSLESLLIRMKRYAADMLDGKNILYDMDFPVEVNNMVINMEQRRDLYMIFKEAVNNLAKYASAAHAFIELSINRQQVDMKIADDGKGFDISQINTGNGLQNMKQRAEKWKGNLSVNSSNGKGTVVSLLMPVAK